MNQADRQQPREELTPASWGTLGAAPRARDLTGATLGDFQVDRLLGRGGMGEVYLARQVSLNREVALKVLRPDLLTNPTYISRFEAEAWAAAKLNHPNIVHIYTLGLVEEMRFIAMEYVQGTNLREYLGRKGTPDLPLALSIMRQAGAAVGAAGEVGLVHRDIKPENLLLTKKGQVKVADFGLCRDLDDDRHHVTQSGVTLGTPLYMSPEQARGQAMDHRSDLYSLGVTFYHMLAGQPPFRAETALALAMKHVSDRPIDLSVHRPDLPTDLTKLVMRLMAKSPGDRYQSAAEMLRDLAKIREALQVSALAAATAANPAPTVVRELSPSGGDSRNGRSSGSRTQTSVKQTLVGLRARLAWPSTRTLAAVAVCGLGVGALSGWMARPADLLTPNPSARPAPPALWIAPAWTEVERKASPAAQYRHAQLLPSTAAREAAWVAVSGYFHEDAEWSSRSYAQLAREMFRLGDRDRLHAFADVLSTTHYGENEALAGIMKAGVAELDGDAVKVLDFFSDSDYSKVRSLIDPSLAEFSLEILLKLRDHSTKLNLSSTAINKLKEVEARVMQRMILIKRSETQG
jgi:serine/threonine-protein kinase